MNLFGKDLTKEVAFVAEIGVNHEGSIDTALTLLRAAAAAGADAVKFQSFTPHLYVTPAESERFQRVSRFQLSREDHDRLVAEAENLGVHFLSAAISEDWVPYIAAHSQAVKIASGDLNFEPVIRAAAATGRPVILSVGLGTLDEIDRAVEWVRDEVGSGALKEHLILLHCVTAYPTPIEQANVLNIPFLRERYGLIVGYSNHVIGAEACYSAAALGASLFEVHFTDRKEGRTFRDHALSFEQSDFVDLIAKVSLIRTSLGTPGATRQPAEAGNLASMRKGITAAHDLAAGTVLSRADIAFARPQIGFACTEMGAVLGQRLNDAVAAGHPLLPKHIG
jgi:N-acetylneuraminate synthase/N,N'-diacetyllegionaminate synthase